MGCTSATFSAGHWHIREAPSQAGSEGAETLDPITNDSHDIPMDLKVLHVCALCMSSGWFVLTPSCYSEYLDEHSRIPTDHPLQCDLLHFNVLFAHLFSTLISLHHSKSPCTCENQEIVVDLPAVFQSELRECLIGYYTILKGSVRSH